MYSIFSKICLIICTILILITIIKKLFGKAEVKENKIEKFIEKNYKYVFFAILIVFIITRIYMICDIPKGMHIDEAATAYNAYNIANYGVDRYNNILPVYFLNFDGGQSPMYTYFAAILIKIFGYSLFIVRIPAVIFGLITLICGYFIGKELTDVKGGLLTSILITICPYFIMSSRWGLDCNLMLGAISASLMTLLFAIKKQKNILYIVSGMLFSLTLYTYAIAYAVVPVILFLILVYLIYTKQIKLKHFFAFSIPFIIASIPIVLNLMVNMGVIGEIKTNFFTLLQMKNDRAAEVSLENIWTNFTKMPAFITNDQCLYNSLPEFKTLYLFSIPFILFGVLICVYKAFKQFKERKFNNYMYIFISFLGMFCALLLVKNVDTIHRGNCLFILLVIFLMIGIYYTIKYIKYSGYVIICMYLISFSFFSYFYFKTYMEKYPNIVFFDYSYANAVKEASKTGKDIYAEPKWNGEVRVALEMKIPPYKYQEFPKQNIIFDNIHLYLPENFDTNYTYVVSKENLNKLKENDFKCKKINLYYVCNKED